MYSVEDEFEKACDYVGRRSNYSKMDQEVLLRLYGYYKQATVGNNNTPKPSFFDFRAQHKWKWWSKLQNMSKSEARQLYVHTLSQAVQNWDAEEENEEQSKSDSWISVSTMSHETDIPASAKDAFDWVKEGDLSRLKLDGKLSATRRDSEGLSLLHWAADRGHADIVKYLVEDVNIDADCRDNENQTPLHYASACGHADICRLLLQLGADMTAKDNEDQTPKDIAETAATKDVFN